MTSEFSKDNPQPTRNFYDLVKIMNILRNECPWDKKQTHESIRDLMVEEIYEAIEAIDQQDFDELKKELGDILLHVLFHAEMAHEKSRFSIDDVIFGIQDKLIRRHPHVFGDVDAKDSDTVTRNWESIKQKEKDRKSVLQGVPETLPGLLKAQRMQEKAGAVGFDWKKWPEAWKKLEEELEEFKEALQDGNEVEKEKEFGDLIFSLVNVGRLAGLDAENSLRLTNTKFKKRFTYIEQKLAVLGKSPSDATLEEMDDLWNESKKLAEFR